MVTDSIHQSIIGQDMQPCYKTLKFLLLLQVVRVNLYYLQPNNETNASKYEWAKHTRR